MSIKKLLWVFIAIVVIIPITEVFQPDPRDEIAREFSTETIEKGLAGDYSSLESRCRDITNHFTLQKKGKEFTECLLQNGRYRPVLNASGGSFYL